ncbi:MAG: helix-turn-helix transcriptional regulator [Candidatus Eremiobacteraeota bacterium]|nr:helix-turn-helix transcriptional regulator [Candidatus Eremiobacteraeota bacterium]
MRDRRLSLEITQADLARISGVSLRRIQQIEADSELANPSLRVLFQIATSLDTTVVVLLGPDRMARAPRRRSPKT